MYAGIWNPFKYWRQTKISSKLAYQGFELNRSPKNVDCHEENIANIISSFITDHTFFIFVWKMKSCEVNFIHIRKTHLHTLMLTMHLSFDKFFYYDNISLFIIVSTLAFSVFPSLFSHFSVPKWREFILYLDDWIIVKFITTKIFNTLGSFCNLLNL